MYFVTSKNLEKIKVQKLLHPLKETPCKIMSKTYETDEKRLKRIHRPTPIDDATQDDDDEICDEIHTNVQLEAPGYWNPIDSRFSLKR